MEYSSIEGTTPAVTSPASVVKSFVAHADQVATAAERPMLVTPKDATMADSAADCGDQKLVTPKDATMADSAADCGDQKGLCSGSHKTGHQSHDKSKKDE